MKILEEISIAYYVQVEFWNHVISISEHSMAASHNLIDYPLNTKLSIVYSSSTFLKNHVFEESIRKEYFTLQPFGSVINLQQLDYNAYLNSINYLFKFDHSTIDHLHIKTYVQTGSIEVQTEHFNFITSIDSSPFHICHFRFMSPDKQESSEKGSAKIILSICGNINLGTYICCKQFDSTLDCFGASKQNLFKNCHFWSNIDSINFVNNQCISSSVFDSLVFL